MATDLGVKARLESIVASQLQYTLLDPEQVEEVGHDILARFYSESEQDPLSGSRRRQIDISDMQPDEAKRSLLSLSIAPSEHVWVIWCSTVSGISVAFGEFVDHYDDLWYPSSDDVWVVDVSLLWLLELNHEEFLVFSARA